MGNMEIEPRFSQKITSEESPRQTAMDHFMEVVSLLKLRKTRTEFHESLADRLIAVAEARRVFLSPIGDIKIAGQAYRDICQQDEKLGQELTSTFRLAANLVSRELDKRF